MTTLARYRSTGILIDTNILLLLIVGSYKRELVGRHKRTIPFLPRDYDLLVRLVGGFDKILTTHAIMCEVSNLASPIADPDRTGILATLRAFVGAVQEHTISSIDACECESFLKIGITDSGILELAKTDIPVLTDDGVLANFIQASGATAFNFHHLRQLDEG